jgi:RNA polymerase sigma-70 factor (ECF subfamily)
VPLEHWVSRVTINTCLKQIQYEGSRPEWRWGDLAVEEQAILDRLAATDDDLSESESVAARELVEKLLQGLTPTDRLVVTMVHLEGRSMEEVSKRTRWSANAVKVRVYRARQKMRAQLESMMTKEALGACLPEAVRLRATAPRDRVPLTCTGFAASCC